MDTYSDSSCIESCTSFKYQHDLKSVIVIYHDIEGPGKQLSLVARAGRYTESMPRKAVHSVYSYINLALQRGLTMFKTEHFVLLLNSTISQLAIYQLVIYYKFA